MKMSYSNKTLGTSTFLCRFFRRSFNVNSIEKKIGELAKKKKIKGLILPILTHTPTAYRALQKSKASLCDLQHEQPQRAPERSEFPHGAWPRQPRPTTSAQW